MKAAMLFLFLIGILSSHVARANAQLGEQLANDVCTTCHIVRRNQDVQPVFGDAIPNFEHIANDAHINRAWLSDFLTSEHASSSNPAGMADLRLTPDQIRDVADFIATLKKSQQRP